MWTPTDSAREVVGFTQAQGVLADTDDPEVLALTAGFLFTEGLIHDLGDIVIMEVCSSDSSIVRVELMDPAGTTPKRRNVTIGSSCSVCGGREAVDELVTELDPIQVTTHLDNEQFSQLMSAMRELQTVFETTGGCHAAAVFNRDAEIIAMAEDLGRHNALDKVIGKCLLRKIELSGCGVTLCGFVRGGRATIYSHPQRIT